MTASIDQDKLNKAEFYAKHIKNWQESGMPQKEYCKSIDISYPAFVYWRIKFRAKSKKPASKEQPTFVPITPQLSTTHIKPIIASPVHQIISIILSNGTQVSLPLTISPITIGEYVKAIRAAS
jgi:hypothetical protein